MPLLQLTVAYEGTRYAGWQRQKNAPTVQAVVEDALRRIIGKRVTVTAAGRTDSGVHAQGQVIHAHAETSLAPAVLRRALNALLPEDVLVRRVSAAPSAFHARYHAVRKRYRYRIATGPLRPLAERRYVHFVPQPLDVNAMRRAARFWVGRHPFAAFDASGRPAGATRQPGATRRRVYAIRIRRQGREVWVDITADGFLYRMARRMVGTLLEIGKGRWPVSTAKALLSRPGCVCAPTAPARGLCLMEVAYR